MYLFGSTALANETSQNSVNMIPILRNIWSS